MHLIIIVVWIQCRHIYVHNFIAIFLASYRMFSTSFVKTKPFKNWEIRNNNQNWWCRYILTVNGWTREGSVISMKYSFKWWHIISNDHFPRWMRSEVLSVNYYGSPNCICRRSAYDTFKIQMYIQYCFVVSFILSKMWHEADTEKRPSILIVSNLT